MEDVTGLLSVKEENAEIHLDNVSFLTYGGLNDWNSNQIDVYISNPDLPRWAFYGSAVTLVLIGISGIIINFTYCVLFLSRKKLQTDFNLLVFDLLLTELLVSAIGIPLESIAAFQLGWKMGELMCKAFGFLLTLLGMNAIGIFTCQMVYRWIILKNKITILRMSRRQTSWTMISFSAIWSFFLAIPPLIGWGSFVPEENGLNCGPSWKTSDDFGYNLFLFTVGFFIPVILIIGFAHQGFQCVKINVQFIACENIRKTSMEKQGRVLYMLIFMTCTFIFSWLPYASLALSSIFGVTHLVPLLYSIFPLVLAKTSILWNGIILYIMNPMFRDELLLWIRYGLKKSTIEEKHSSTRGDNIP